jgi:sensor histidine kinase YesM
MNPRPQDGDSVAIGGVGLRNSAERLRLLFGPRASLRLDLSQASVAIAEVRVPA